MLLANQEYSDKSLKVLAKCSLEGRLIISEVVHAELLISFLTGETDLKIEEFLKEVDISVTYTQKNGLVIGLDISRKERSLKKSTAVAVAKQTLFPVNTV